MKQANVLARFGALNVWRRRGQRAPHKPLLVLYALGRLSRGEAGPLSFEQAEADLTALLKEFGPPRVAHHPEYPFWRLQNDGVWAVEADGPLETRKGHSDPKKTELLRQRARGSFSPPVLQALQTDPHLIREVAARLLDGHFPESLHPAILEAVGLSLEHTTSAQQKRDPSFRPRVLTAYEYRCAVCGFDVRLGDSLVALDAAHIRWHQAGGPDEETNGLALCVLHHRTFDLGAFTVGQDLRLLVSDQAHGSRGLEETLLRHHGRAIREPQRPEHRPDEAHLAWHAQEVFKGEARHLS